MSYPTLPVKTSYMSVSTYLDNHIGNKIAIALDICRNYYHKVFKEGQNIKVLSIDGYGEFLDIDDITLGCWMTFEKLFGEYPPAGTLATSNQYVGWNGDYSNPSINIPEAFYIYDVLNSKSIAYEDREMKYATCVKWFHKTGNAVGVHQTYEVLEAKNPAFYKWLDEKLTELVTSMDFSNIQIPAGVRSYLYDVRPEPKFYDKMYGARIEELLYVQLTLLEVTKFYQKFLSAFESVIYSFTKQLLPVRVFGMITYMFQFYTQHLVEFLKPYHASLIPLNPMLIIGDDNDEMFNIMDNMKTKITKQVIDLYEGQAYDSPFQQRECYDQIKEFNDWISISQKHLNDQFTITSSVGGDGTGGIIDPLGDTVITRGTTLTFNMIPESAMYGISSLVVDGDSITPDSRYTFVDIHANHTIQVTYVNLVPNFIEPDGEMLPPLADEASIVNYPLP